MSRQSDSEPLDFVLLRKEIATRGDSYQTVALCKQLHSQLAYLPHLLKQVIYLATSSAVVLDSYSLAVSLLADSLKIPVLQIWHGVGNMKKFGYTAIDTPEGNSSKIAKLMRMHAGYDSVLVSSTSFAHDFASGLGVPESLLFECPLPRCDMLRDQAGQARDREFLHQLSCGRPVVVYAPTFRRQTTTNVTTDATINATIDAASADSTIPEQTAKTSDDKQIAELTEAKAINALFTNLLERGFAIAYRPHPVSHPATKELLTNELASNPYLLTDFSACPPEFNLVRAADVLVSDYSTIIYEAGLAGVPVYLYGYDWEQYRQRRGLYIDPSQDIPTVFSKDPQTIADAVANNACQMEQFAAFIHRNVSLPSSGSCAAKAIDHVFDLISRGKTYPQYWSLPQ